VRNTKIIRLLDHGARVSDEDLAGRSVKDCVKADWIRGLIGQADRFGRAHIVALSL
jgi:hypothetical protein